MSTHNVEQYARMAERGMSAAQIAAEAGTTRDAVLGALFRAKLAIDRPVKPPKPLKPIKDRRGGKRLEPGEIRVFSVIRQPFAGGRGGTFPIDFKVQCVAHVLMARGDYAGNGALHGFGYGPSAKRLGVDSCSLAKWCRDPRYTSRAQAMADEMRAFRRASADLMAAVEVLALEEIDRARYAHNVAVANMFSGRFRSFALRVADGESASQIGASVGLTRERIRQILQPVLASGLDTSHMFGGGYAVNQKPPKRPVGRPRKVQSPVSDRPLTGWTPEKRAAAAEQMRERHAAGRIPHPSKKRRMSPADLGLDHWPS